MRSMITGLILCSVLQTAHASTGATTQKAKQNTTLFAKKKLVQAFVRKHFQALMKKYRVPGAIISIVEGDKEIASFGFGKTALKDGHSIDPHKTLFRVGSLSKLVTATAIMRLREQKKLDLHTDLEHYTQKTGRALKRRFGQPLTAAQLLTHTSGLDVTDIGDATKSAKAIVPLQSYLSTHMTPVIYPPGQFHVYTNHGYALLGALLERQHKKPFHESINDLVFAPLGMTHSSFAQPLPAPLLKTLVKSVTLDKKGRYVQLPIDYSNVAPADALATTAHDMGRFMRAHLNHGTLGSKVMLRRETLEEMHAQQFTYHKEIAGHTYGFKEAYFGRHMAVFGPRRALYHTGGQLGFTSVMYLVPEWKFGMFICLNRRVGRMRRSFARAFFQTFSPYKPIKPRLQAIKDPTPYIGSYMRMGYPSHSLEALIYLVNPRTLLHVKAAPKDSLHLSGYGVLQRKKGDLLQKHDGTEVVSFRRKKGNITHFFIEQRAYRRVGWLDNPDTHRTALFFSLLLFIGVLLQWVVSLFWRRSGEREQATHIAQTLARVVSLVFIVFFVGLLIVLGQVAGMGWDYGVSSGTRLLQKLPYIGMVSSVLLLFFTWKVIQRPDTSLLWKLALPLVTLAGLACSAILSHYHLMSLSM